MSTPAAKRRRIDAAQTLSKPFRSPFKTPFKSPLKNSTPTMSSLSTETLSSLNTPTSTANEKPNTVLTPKPTNIIIPHPSSLQNPATTKTPLRAPPPRSKKTFSSPVSAAALNADPDIAPLLKTQRELEKLLKEVKEELEAAEQARKIERESEKWEGASGNGEWKGEIDGELIELVGKWKGASRQAAEELFGKVRDRVNRMGGPRAWKEAQKKQQEYQSGWDQEDQNNNNGDSDSDDDNEGEKKDVEKRDLYAEYGIDPETENEKSQRVKGVGDTGEMPGQEDEFTMAMMLRTLNVDLDIIGYDREGQRWMD